MIIETWILHELEAFIGKAFKGEVVVYYFEPLTRPPRLSGSRWRAGNAADGSLRLALWVKIDEKNRLASDLKYKTSFSLIFIQDLGNGWAETIGQRIR